MEGFGRRVAARPAGFGARIRFVWERDEFGVPSFWVLQVLGWAGFYGLILLTIVLPSHSKQELWNQTLCWAMVFAGSWLLHPACRAMLRKPRPWLILESRAFALAVAVGALCTFAMKMAKSRDRIGLATLSKTGCSPPLCCFFGALFISVSSNGSKPCARGNGWFGPSPKCAKRASLRCATS